MAKLHIGLVAESKAIENDIKESSQQFGGAYVHHSKTIYELLQKLTMQKVQMIIVVLPKSGEGSDFGAMYSFIRSKRDLQKVPVCVLTEGSRFEIPFLLNDVNVRSFPLSGGLFLPLLSMAPLINGTPDGTITEDWIKKEFLQSLSANVGQGVQFVIRDASEDERRAAFFSQNSEEVRTHLGWFKFTARLLETEKAGMSKMFEGMSRDMIEVVSQALVNKVTEDFKQKVSEDISTRGAVYLPEIDKLSPADRKWVYSNTKYKGILFEAPECHVLLEIGQTI